MIHICSQFDFKMMIIPIKKSARWYSSKEKSLIPLFFVDDMILNLEWKDFSFYTSLLDFYPNSDVSEWRNISK